MQLMLPLYIHCSCHRLQLASMQAAELIPAVKMFGTMGNLWKLFYYSPQKAEAQKEVQSVLMVVKPSDTRWLSKKQYVRTIRKELSALIVTLQQLSMKLVITRYQAPPHSPGCPETPFQLEITAWQLQLGLGCHSHSTAMCIKSICTVSSPSIQCFMVVS